MIVVLRYGHRKERDKRITTHVALVARAFGADGIIISGEEDDTPIKSIEQVVKNWGGSFFARFEKNWRKVLKEWKKKGGIIVHLTMYGLPVQDVMPELRKLLRHGRDMLIFVGAEKVPAEVYQIADYNVAIGNQPHSEVAALAIFLHELFEGRELNRSFEGARLRIIPQARGKKVLKS